MRSVKEIRQGVLSDNRPYEPVYGPKKTGKDPSPLAVKDVAVGSHRYVVCRNADQARKDRADREAIVESLREQLKRGDKSLVGNKGYRKYLKTPHAGRHFAIDLEKIRREAKYDGIWVLRTDLELPAREVALRYKELWRVESIFRTIKSVLASRPIYHKCDETIRGHVFCSFLALMLLKELQRRLADRGWIVEWDRLRDDLDNLTEITVKAVGQSFVIRSVACGEAGKAVQATGVALGPVIRPLSDRPT